MTTSKKILLISLFILSATLKSFCQTNDAFTYLIVNIDVKLNYTGNKYNAVINAEATNKYAAKIYSLKAYDGSIIGINKGAAFFSDHTDSAQAIYNYFQNATEALQFLADDKWVLITVISEVNSSYKNENGVNGLVPITTVSSRPVYYFKKQIIK
jgi:hypothetical protein